MTKMNWARVLLGGLAAGVILDVLEGAVSPRLVGGDYAREITALGISVRPTAGAIVFFILLGFIVGVLTIWLYAAIRPRFGPGPKTALCAAVVVWLLNGLLPHLVNAFTGIFSLKLEINFSLILLMWLVIATLAGAWLYCEAPLTLESSGASTK